MAPPATSVRASRRSAPLRIAEPVRGWPSAGRATGGSVRFCGTNMRMPSTSDQGPGLGEQCGAQGHRECGAHDEGEFVDDRFERVGGV